MPDQDGDEDEDEDEAAHERVVHARRLSFLRTLAGPMAAALPLFLKREKAFLEETLERTVPALWPHRFATNTSLCSLSYCAGGPAGEMTARVLELERATYESVGAGGAMALLSALAAGPFYGENVGLALALCFAGVHLVGRHDGAPRPAAPLLDHPPPAAPDAADAAAEARPASAPAATVTAVAAALAACVARAGEPRESVASRRSVHPDVWCRAAVKALGRPLADALVASGPEHPAHPTARRFVDALADRVAGPGCTLDTLRLLKTLCAGPSTGADVRADGARRGERAAGLRGAGALRALVACVARSSGRERERAAYTLAMVLHAAESGSRAGGTTTSRCPTPIRTRASPPTPTSRAAPAPAAAPRWRPCSRPRSGRPGRCWPAPPRSGAPSAGRGAAPPPRACPTARRRLAGATCWPPGAPAGAAGCWPSC